MIDPQTVARMMGGRVERGGALVPGPGHSPADRSLKIFVDPHSEDGFRVHSFAGDDPIACRDHVRQRLGLPAWMPSRQETRSNGMTNGRQQPICYPTEAPTPLASGPSLPVWTAPDANGKPLLQVWGEEGPPLQSRELRRHVYRCDGTPVRIKLKNGPVERASFVNWYRVVAPTGQVGWQAKKPADYRSVPYMPVGLDPFDREFGGEDIYWPEGERDVETLARLCVPSFTFGGCGDGLPIDIAPRLSGRHIVILADNDQPGRTHADKKAVVALEAGAASVRVLHFPELAEHEDVSDYIAQGGTAEDLAERTSHAPPWQPAASGNQSTRSERLEIVCMADVTPKAVEWLWENWVAIGKVSVLAGDGGQGKSTILCDLAARTTQGEQWPNGAPSTAPGGVIILAAEDDVEDTLAPRLIAVGADLKRVFNIRSVTSDDNGRRSFNLQADLAALERQIAAHGDIRLVIIDPISSYLGKVDSHKNADVRSVLEPLGEMAARMRVAVICNNHFSKGAGNANSRIIGSVAFVNQARAAFIVTPDAETEGRYLLMPSKMNNAPMKHGLGYRIESCLIPSDGQEVLTSRVAWESTPVTITADEALAAHSDKGEAKSAKAEAIEFLKDALQNGPRAAGEIKTEATAAGITAKPLRSARTVLGVKPTKTGMAGGWLWALPKVPNDAEGAHVSKRASSDPEGTFGRGKL